MVNSIFGIASPKFKDLDTDEIINFRCRILKDEQDYKEIMHQSIIDLHREWNDIPEHWIYECEVLLLKYPEDERKDFYLLLDSYENKIIEFWRRNDGNSMGNFRVDEVTPYYLDHPDYPDKIFMRFISIAGHSQDINDEQVVNISAIDDEALYPLNNGTFRISRTGDAVGNLTVNFVVSGTAVSGIDYTNIGTSVIIPDGSSYIDITVVPLNNSAIEILTAIVTLSESVNYTLGDFIFATVNILFVRDGDLILLMGVCVSDAPDYDFITSLGNNIAVILIFNGGAGNYLQRASYSFNSDGEYVKADAVTSNVPYFVCHIYRNAEIGDSQHYEDVQPSSTTALFPALTLEDDSGDSWIAAFCSVRGPGGQYAYPPTLLPKFSKSGYPSLVSCDSDGGVTEWEEVSVPVSLSEGYEVVTAVIEIKRKDGAPPIEFIWGGIATNFGTYARLDLPPI